MRLLSSRSSEIKESRTFFTRPWSMVAPFLSASISLRQHSLDLSAFVAEEGIDSLSIEQKQA